jgi:branched-chain amino acid transport system substrate-binding protein
VSVAVVLLLALGAAACGSRLPDDALAKIDAQQAGSVRDDTGSNGSSGSSGSSDVTVVAGPDGATGGAVAATDGGDGSAAVADPGGGTSTGAGTTTGGPAADCHGGATAPGVTATEIKVGTIVTASGPLPGATEGDYRGTQAYFAKVNAEGGVCGRKLTALKGDDGLDPQRARGEFLRLEPQILAMVGNLAVADSGYGDLVRATGVPYVGTLVDPAGRGPTVYPRILEKTAHTAPFQYYRTTYPNVQKVAFLYADVGGVRANTPTSREPIKKVGFQIVHDSGLSSVSPDYTSDVIAMRDKGAQMVYLFAFEVNMHVRLARNMRQQNFEPTLKVSQIGYDSRLIPLLGNVAEGWTNHIDYLPVLNEDEPAQSPALGAFLTWNQRVAPSAKVDFFTVTGWTSADLFVRALKAVGPDVTRARLLAALDAITNGDGAGIHAPVNPRTGATQGCFIIVRIKGGKWVREHPSSGFDCGHGQSFRYG